MNHVAPAGQVGAPDQRHVGPPGQPGPRAPGPAGPRGPAEPSGTGPAGAAPPGNLPPRLTSFVGRADELRALAAALARHRLVTIIGPAGSGSRLTCQRHSRERRRSGFLARPRTSVADGTAASRSTRR